MNKLLLIKNLQVGDRLVREKGIFSTHHGIYAGVYNGVAWVAENQIWAGVRYVSLNTFLNNDVNNLVRVKPFMGTEIERQNIIPKLNTLIGTQYNLVNFNCEHFAELIQNGKARSKQVDNSFIIMVLLLLVLAIAKSDKNKRIA
jgi:hypothetical protein